MTDEEHEERVAIKMEANGISEREAKLQIQREIWYNTSEETQHINEDECWAAYNESGAMDEGVDYEDFKEGRR